MKKFFKTYFTFNRAERNGVIILLSLIFLLIVIKFALPQFYSKKSIDYSDFQNQLDAFELALQQKEDAILEDTLFYFDPNILSIEGWQKLGLKNKQIQTIQNYIAKGGRFFEADDLKKIYGLNAQDYARIKDWVRIENDETSSYKVTDNNIDINDVQEIREKEKIFIELNSADSLTLLMLKGIGPSFSGRILKYRSLLGGFHRKEQLMEVYGFDTTRLNDIADNIYIDQDRIEKIGLNTADYRKLIRHPYLNKYYTEAILAYRNKVKVIKSESELIDNKVVTLDIYEKLSPYLGLE